MLTILVSDARANLPHRGAIIVRGVCKFFRHVRVLSVSFSISFWMKILENKNYFPGLSTRLFLFEVSNCYWLFNCLLNCWFAVIGKCDVQDFEDIHYYRNRLTTCASDYFADRNEWPNRIQQFAFFLKFIGISLDRNY